jgi:hypothetical protein
VNLKEREDAMKDMDRREFMKTVAVGGAVLGIGTAVFHQPLRAHAGEKFDIGQCKSVRV